MSPEDGKIINTGLCSPEDGKNPKYRDPKYKFIFP